MEENRVLVCLLLLNLIEVKYIIYGGLLWWLSRKESTCQCRRCRFDPWFEKISWRRKWQPTLVFLPAKTQGQRSMGAYSPWGCKDSDN